MPTKRKKRKHGGLKGPITGACASIERRANRDFSALVRAWDRRKAARTRFDNLRRFGGWDPKAFQRAVTAIEQAEADILARSASVDRAFAASNKCLRRIGGR